MRTRSTVVLTVAALIAASVVTTSDAAVVEPDSLSDLELWLEAGQWHFRGHRR
ncbi:MAG: hypothetical protein MI757_23360 [Pirellulales bacterium]|nr:hypothetical protein [Pirellulales bacterium]